MIKALIFDLGRVLVKVSYEAAYARFANYSTLGRSEIARRLHDSGLPPAFECGKISPPDFARQVCRLLEVSIPYDEFCALWYTVVDQGPIIPAEFLAALHRRYRLVLLSNTNALHYEMLRPNCPLLDHFDAYTLSYVVGVMKPDEAIYRDAVAKAGCDPRECFYTDDIPAYVDAAARLGIHAFQFRGLDRLKLDLLAAGVEV